MKNDKSPMPLAQSELDGDDFYKPAPKLTYLDDDEEKFSTLEDFEWRESGLPLDKTDPASLKPQGIIQGVRALRQRLKENRAKVSPEMNRLSRQLMKCIGALIPTFAAMTCTRFDSPLYRFIGQLEISVTLKSWLFWASVSVFYISEPVLYILLAFCTYFLIQMAFQEKAEEMPTIRETLRHLK